MPVVTLPLCSLDATGTIAGQHTFYPRDGKTILRRRVVGANPSSADQVTARAAHSMTTHLIKWAGACGQASDGQPATDRQRVRAVTPQARRWVDLLYTKALEDGQANTRGALAQWELLSTADQNDWHAAAAALTPPITSWTPTTAPGAAPPTFTAGQLFFVWRYLLFLVKASDAPPSSAPPLYA
jgi:hypothetical protein